MTRAQVGELEHPDVQAAIEREELTPIERRLLGDLFAILEEHSHEAAVVVDRDRVEHRPVAAHHLLALQAPQPPLGRGRRDRHRLREVGQARPPVVGEVVEDPPVETVQGWLGGSVAVWGGHGDILRLTTLKARGSPGIARGCGRIVEP